MAKSPKCGEPLEESKKEGEISEGRKKAGLGCFLVLGIMGAIAFFSGGGEQKNSSQNNASPSAAYTTGSSFKTADSLFGCRSLEKLKKASQIARSKDMEAFKSFMVLGVASGECALIPAGSTVFVDDTKLLDGAILVRQQGQTLQYWTNMP